jgi:hypothetical protein
MVANLGEGLAAGVRASLCVFWGVQTDVAEVMPYVPMSSSLMPYVAYIDKKAALICALRHSSCQRRKLQLCSSQRPVVASDQTHRRAALKSAVICGAGHVRACVQ